MCSALLFFDSEPLSHAKLTTVLSKLGTMPECERHLVSKIYQTTFPKPINFQPCAINGLPFHVSMVLKALAATLLSDAFCTVLHCHLENNHPSGRFFWQ